MTAHTFRTDVFSSVLTWNNITLKPVSGWTPEQYDLVVQRYGFTDNGGDTDETANRSTWSLTGYASTNTTKVAKDGVLTQRIYFKGVISGSDYVISGWTDAAMTASKVVEGTETGNNGGTVTLAEQNSSGLSGSVVLAAAAAADTWYVDVELYHDRYDGSADSAANNILGFLWFEDLTNESDIENWKYAETGSIVNFDGLLDVAGIDNVADVYARKLLRDQLRARGWTV